MGRDAVTMLTLTGVRGTLKRPLNDDKTASGKGDNAKDGSTTVKKPKTKSAKQPHTPALQQPSWDVRVGSETPRTPAQQQQQQQVGQQKSVTSSNSQQQQQQQQQPDGQSCAKLLPSRDSAAPLIYALLLTHLFFNPPLHPLVRLRPLHSLNT